MQNNTTTKTDDDASRITLDDIQSDLSHLFHLVDIALENFVSLDRPTEQNARVRCDRVSAMLWLAVARVQACAGMINDYIRHELTDFREVCSLGGKEVSVLNAMVHQYEEHRIAWEATSNGRGELIDRHPEMIAMDHAARSFAQFPVTTEDGMRAKARALLRNSTLHGDIMDNADEDLREAFLRSMAGPCKKGEC